MTCDMHEKVLMNFLERGKLLGENNTQARDKINMV